MITRLGYDSRLISIYKGLLFVAMSGPKQMDIILFLSFILAVFVVSWLKNPLIQIFILKPIFFDYFKYGLLTDLGRWAVAHNPIL